MATINSCSGYICLMPVTRIKPNYLAKIEWLGIHKNIICLLLFLNGLLHTLQLEMVRN